MKELTLLEISEVNGGLLGFVTKAYKTYTEAKKTRRTAGLAVGAGSYQQSSKSKKNNGKPSGSCHKSKRTGSTYCTGGR